MSEALDLTDLSSIDEIENEWIAMPDGARLAARIWKPKDADRNPVPAILEFIPYRKRDFMRSRDEPMHRYFALHGYASVRVDLRGSGRFRRRSRRRVFARRNTTTRWRSSPGSSGNRGVQVRSA